MSRSGFFLAIKFARIALWHPHKLGTKVRAAIELRIRLVRGPRSAGRRPSRFTSSCFAHVVVTPLSTPGSSIRPQFQANRQRPLFAPRPLYVSLPVEQSVLRSLRLSPVLAGLASLLTSSVVLAAGAPLVVPPSAAPPSAAASDYEALRWKGLEVTLPGPADTVDEQAGEVTRQPRRAGHRLHRDQLSYLRPEHPRRGPHDQRPATLQRSTADVFHDELSCLDPTIPAGSACPAARSRSAPR